MSKLSSLSWQNFVLPIFIAVSACTLKPDVAQQTTYFDAAHWGDEVHSIVADHPPSPLNMGSVVFVGSSSIRLWAPQLADDMCPVGVAPNGFGGSTAFDAYAHIKPLVLDYAPSAVVFYEGDNDIAVHGVSPHTVRDVVRAFISRIHDDLPETRVYILSIKPSPARMEHWPAMKEANAMLSEDAAHNELVTFIDVASILFDEEGALRGNLFRDDGIHMNRQGYLLWREIIRTQLLGDLPVGKEKTVGADVSCRSPG